MFRTILLAALLGTVISSTGATSANAQDSTTEQVKFTYADIQAAEQAISSDEADAAVEDYLDEQMRSGTRVDRSNLHYASLALNGETALTGDIDLVWSQGMEPRATIQYTEGESSAGFAMELVTEPSESAAHRSSSAGNVGGYQAGSIIGATDLYLFNTDCADASAESYTIRSCYEKWAESGMNLWVYNRWTTLNITSSIVYANDFTVRASPWLDDPSIDYLQRQHVGSSIETCGGSATINILFVTFGPSTACGSISPVSNLTRDEFGSDYSPSLGSLGLWEGTYELAAVGEYRAVDSNVIPVFADYNWPQLFWAATSLMDSHDERCSFTCEDTDV